MFSKSAIVAALAALVVACPTPPPSNNCNVGSQQCCQSVQSSSDPATSTLLGQLGVTDPVGADIPIGLTCSPITGVGLGSGGGCNAQPVCCQNNSFNGVIAIGCVIINVNA